MENNLQNFPREFFQKEIVCVVPSTAQPGQIFYFNPDGNLDESIVNGLQFLPSDGYFVKIYLGGNKTQASSTDATNALISLVNKNDENIMQEYPVNGLNNVFDSTKIVQRIVRLNMEICLKKCFIKWTAAAPVTNIHFIFSIFYKPIYK